MKQALRSGACVLMLASACALAAAIALALATALVVAMNISGHSAILAGIVAVVVLASVGVWRWKARRKPERRPAGVQVSSAEQPTLWMEVHRISQALNARMPDQILLVPDVSATVATETMWFGLRPGVCRLKLGMPLLFGLTERQLTAVLAQELFRSSSPRSLATFIYGGSEAIGRIVARLGRDSKTGALVAGYGRAYAALSAPINQAHELRADSLAAEIAGKGAISSALRQVALMGRAWGVFLSEYAEPAAFMQRRPQGFLEGFGAFLAEPSRQAGLDQEMSESLFQHPLDHNSHSSLAVRLNAIASLPDDSMHDGSGVALGMVRSAGRESRRIEDWMFQGSGLVPATWEEISAWTGRTSARDGASQLERMGDEGGLGSTLSVATLLDVVRHGLADEMVRPFLPQGAPPDAERQMAGRLVTAFLVTAAIESGTVNFRLSWAASRQMVDGHGTVSDLPGLVDAALADPGNVCALELWLREHQVELTERVVEGDPEGEAELGVQALQTPLADTDHTPVAEIHSLALP